MKRLCKFCIDVTIEKCSQCSVGQEIIDDYDARRMIAEAVKKTKKKKKVTPLQNQYNSLFDPNLNT